MKRATFIENSVQIRERFSFAHPTHILKAIQTECCDFYGSRLWDLFGNSAAQVYRSWNTCVKLVWGLPRKTHTVFVKPLSCNMPSVRIQILGRYLKFFESLLRSPSKEVAVVSRIVGRDAKTVTGLNILNIRLETEETQYSKTFKVKKKIFENYFNSEIEDEWKVNLLFKYMRLCEEMRFKSEDTSYIDSLIDSLCSN